MNEKRIPLEFTNPNRGWVVGELDKLWAEWLAWEKTVATIVDQPYDRNTHSSVFADGEGNMETHAILQNKTLTFLENNLAGHGFIIGMDGTGCDRIDLRLKIRVKHRLHDLRILRASLEYARVPDGFWKQRAKSLVDRILEKGSDSAVDIAESYLKNPLAIDKK